MLSGDLPLGTSFFKNNLNKLFNSVESQLEAKMCVYGLRTVTQGTSLESALGEPTSPLGRDLKLKLILSKLSQAH